MTPTATLARYPAGRPLTADQVTEFHAARLLLVLHLCGTSSRIDGLTKLAKLDFFVRYPDFFRRAQAHLADQTTASAGVAVESAMVRHHYGPWDARYYQVLAYLESRELIAVTRKGKGYVFSLTPAGLAVARQLAREPSYHDLATHMRAVKSLLGGKTGEYLKKLVYALFEAEVARLPLGRVIEP